MRFTVFLPACFTLLLLCGCGTVVVRDDPRPVRAADGVMVETIPIVEAMLSRTGTVVQAVSGSWKENAFAAEVVMKGDGREFTAVFLAPQMRLATITLSRPHSIRYERAAQIPRMFEPEYALFDLALANLDTDTLKRTLPGLDIADDGTVLRVGTANAPVAELVRNPAGDRMLRNLVHGYEYTVKNIPLR